MNFLKEILQKIKDIDLKREFIVWILTGLLILIFLSIISYHPTDPSITTATGNSTPKNICGSFGSYISDILVQTFGIGAIFIPFFIFLYLINIVKRGGIKLKNFIAFIFFIIFLSLLIHTIYPHSINFRKGIILSGGVIGEILYNFFISFLKITGTAILVVTLFIISSILTFEFSILKFITEAISFIVKMFLLFKSKIIYFTPIFWRKLKNFFKKKDNNSNKEKKESNKKKKSENKNNKKKTEKNKKDSKEQQEEKKEKKSVIPPVDLLGEVPKRTNKIEKDYLEQKKEVLLEKFNDFGITGDVVNIITGPVVTLFEFKPSPGIKLSKITSLANDLTMALKALSVRIVAPIPGKEVVGIEIPNEKRENVYFKDIIQSEQYKKSESLLTIALGKTIDGTPYVSDLAKMPHLLVAGSTGSGKSVCINTIMMSILFRASHEDVRFILVDPKILELSIYNGIPHLLLPVVTEPEKAAISLKWAIGEMDRRYDLLAKAGVRDIKEYNKKVEKKEDKLSYIVIIIDELADLMMIAPKDVETSIARLTQKARAAGIHVILATQRPSVDIITGVIKNNLPSRIAFKVTSRADSRTILDSMGAESLLGLGDMLFIPPGASSPVRLQGAFITNKEITNVTDYLKSVAIPKYMEDEILNYDPDESKQIRNGMIINSGDSNDPLYNDILGFVKTLETVSISMIQRRFKIGYNKAATYIERMEEEGIVGPPDGSKPRKVLVKR